MLSVALYCVSTCESTNRTCTRLHSRLDVSWKDMVTADGVAGGSASVSDVAPQYARSDESVLYVQAKLTYL